MINMKNKIIRSLPLFIGALVVLSAGFVNAAPTDLAGDYCISGFDPTLCGSGISYVGTAHIEKRSRGGEDSFVMDQYFPSVKVKNCFVDAQTFRAIGLKLGNQLSFALTSGTGQPPSQNVYNIGQNGVLSGKWVYQDDYRVGTETLTKTANLSACPTAP